MTITEAARRYRTDGATIWSWIVRDRIITSPDGRSVQLRAERDSVEKPWNVTEVPTA